jgi:hypothetical protein
MNFQSISWVAASGREEAESNLLATSQGGIQRRENQWKMSIRVNLNL